MKKRIVIYGILLATGGFMDTGNAAEQIPGVAAKPTSYFYTGKPYDRDLGAYVFAARSYNPAVSRWTTCDLSGFPDGSNNQAYEAIPTCQFDPDGLNTQDYTESFKTDSTHNWTVSATFTITFTPTVAPTAGGNARCTGDVSNATGGQTYTYSDSSIVIDPSLPTLKKDPTTGKHYWDFSVRFYSSYSVATQSTASMISDFFGISATADSTHTFNTQEEQTYHLQTSEFE